MITLGRSAAIRGFVGDPLPPGVWGNLAQLGARFSRGQLALVAAGPGVGKSAFVLSYALKSGVFCMYFSAVSDVYTQLARALAIMGNMTMEEAETLARSNNPAGVASIVQDVPIKFSYNLTPSLKHIQD